MIPFLLKWCTTGTIFMLAAFSVKDAIPASGIVPLHPFYVSVTEISHNQKENTIEISCKMFADDLESTLKTQNTAVTDLYNPKDTRQAEKFVNDYLQKHLQMKVNGKPVLLQFVGYEKESESAWCYLQVNGIAQVKKLDISNSLLYEMSKTQMGIIHASAGGIRKSTRLVNPDTSAVIEW